MEMVDDPTSKDGSASETAPQFLKLQKSGMGRQARAFRLKQGDVLVAIDGNAFTGDAAMLRNVFGGTGSADGEEDVEHDDDDTKVVRYLLTFFR